MTKEEYVEYFVTGFQDILKLEDDYEVTRRTHYLIMEELQKLDLPHEELVFVKSRAINSPELGQICERIEYILDNKHGEMVKAFGRSPYYG